MAVRTPRGGSLVKIGTDFQLVKRVEEEKNVFKFEFSFGASSDEVFEELLAASESLKVASENIREFGATLAEPVAFLADISEKLESATQNLLSLEERTERDEDEARPEGPLDDESSELFADAARRLDDASLTFEALVQALGDAVARIDGASRQLQDAVDELFGPGGEAPGVSPNGFQRASFPSAGRLPPASDTAARFDEATRSGWLYADALGGIEQASAAVADVLVLDDARLGTVAESLDRASESVGGFGETLNEIEAIGKRAFAGLEGALEKFARTGRFELRDLANVAIQALRDIVEAQVNAAGASSSGGGLLGVLRGIFGGGGGTFVPASLGPQFTGTGGLGLLSSGSFAHGGRPPVGVPVLVGEEGPELFVPPGPGEIVPNDRLGGFGGASEPNIVVTYNVDARGAELGVEQRLRRMLAEHQRDTVRRTMGAIFRDAQRGGMMSRLSRR